MNDYKLVPVEPTPKMLQVWKSMHGYSRYNKYKAMLAAAPAVQVESVEFCEDAALSIAERTFSMEADARLIAAAPDLLDSAQLALSIAESFIHDQLDGTGYLEGALQSLDPVRAAIAKALGEEQ